MFEGQADTYELYRCIHWKKIKILIRKAMHMSRVNVEDFDIDNIRAYEATGITFMGNNVKTNLINNGCPFERDCHYEFYEIPKKGKRSKGFGEFYLLAYNEKFDSWISGIIFSSEKSVILDMHKHFTISFSKKKFKIASSFNMTTDAGYSMKTNFKFDRFNIRKRAYQPVDIKPKNSPFVSKKPPVKKDR